MPDSDVELHDVEKWFYRRGLPFFVEDYRSSTGVWTRASPFLAVTFVVMVVSAALSFETTGGAVAALIVSAALAISLAVVNSRAGRRWWALPRRVSWPVLVGFVVVPVIIAVAALGNLDGIADYGVPALLILGFVWVVTRFAILPLTGWAIRYTFRGFSDLYRLTTRALPLMLLFVIFLFLNADVWQVMGTLSTTRLWLVVILFVVLGVVFIIGRVSEEVDLIESATTRSEVITACAGTPLAAVVESLDGLDSSVQLTRQQRLNIGLVMIVAQVVQVSLFAVVVWLFLLAFGALTVSADVQASWLDGIVDVDTVWAWSPGYGVTAQLMRVSVFLAAFSGFYVTIYTSIDAVYREQFYDRIRADLERSLSVRRAYVALRRRP